MLKYTKIITAVLVCIAMLFSLCACNGSKTVMDTISNLGKSKEEEPIDEIGFTIPYLRTDSLDPYKASNSMNKYISHLIYDSLYNVDGSFKESAVIAESYTISDKALTVKIKSGLKFTDAAYLENIDSADASGDNAVTFALKSSDGSEVANLVFPIVKSGSYDEASTDNTDDSDGEENTTASSGSGYTSKIPIGSGRYTFVSGNEAKYLQYNKSRLGSYNPKYAKIGLVDISASESFSSLFNLSKIDFYCDNFDSGKYTKFSKISSNIELTNLVYLGINSQRNELSEPKVRRAIALALNRAELASDSFAGCAVATSLPFHPSYYKLSGCTLPTLNIKTDNAENLLDEAGYSNINSSGTRYNEDKVMNLTLLVNSENDFRRSMARGIQQALEKINITVTIREVSYSDYASAVESESFDMYIGETTSAFRDFSPPKAVSDTVFPKKAKHQEFTTNISADRRICKGS